MFSYETHFYLDGFVENKQNFRYWSSTNHEQSYECLLHSPKATVWCGVTKTCVIGPYFFEEGGGMFIVISESVYVTNIPHP